jgi:hypothetical protein
MKVIVLFVMIAAILAAADATYALGGGGHNGEGRWADMQNTRHGFGNFDDSDRHYGRTKNGNERATANVPEPATLLLLSLGVIGMAGMKRVLKKQS